jgi:hypothetical protein
MNSSFYGEGGEEALERAVEKDELDEFVDLSWLQMLRLWLYRTTKRRLQEQSGSESTLTDTTVDSTATSSAAGATANNLHALQHILSLLHAQHGSSSTHVHDDNDDDDLMLVSATSADTEEDVCLRYWNQHQRFFILRDLERVWCGLSVSEQSLLRMIVPLIDRVATATATELPAWMTTTIEKLKQQAQANIPSQICQEYWIEREALRRQSVNEQQINTAISATTARPRDKFISWIRSKLPIQEERQQFASYCEQLGREGSRGPLHRRLLKQLVDDRSVEECLRQSLLDCNPETADARRGKALMESYLTISAAVLNDGEARQENSAANVQLVQISIQPVSSSIRETVEQYVTQTESPNLHALVAWLWVEATTTSVVDGADAAVQQRRTEILDTVRDLADWIPFPSLMLSHRKFCLDQIVTLIPQAQKLHAAKMVADMLLAWFGDASYEWRSMAWNWMGHSEPLVDASLLLYHSYTFLLTDNGQGPNNLDIASILTSCAVFAILLNPCSTPENGVVSYDRKSCISSFGTIVDLFTDVQRPLSGMTDSVGNAVDEIQTSFRGIRHESLRSDSNVPVLSAEDFMRTAMDFCLNNSALAPEWCRITAANALLKWETINPGAVWISQLLRFMKKHDNVVTLPPLLKMLHTEMVRQAWSSPQPQSLVQVLEDSSRDCDLSALECIVTTSPTTHLFLIQGGSKVVATVCEMFESALRLFGESTSALPHIFLGLALQLDAVMTEAVEGSASARKDCLQTARNFLLDKVRGSEFQDEAPFRHDWVHGQLSSYGAKLGREWWKDVCIDIVDRPNGGFPMGEALTHDSYFVAVLACLDDGSDGFQNPKKRPASAANAKPLLALKKPRSAIARSDEPMRRRQFAAGRFSTRYNRVHAEVVGDDVAQNSISLQAGNESRSEDDYDDELNDDILLIDM